MNRPFALENDKFDCIKGTRETSENRRSSKRSKQVIISRCLRENKTNLYEAESPQQTENNSPAKDTAQQYNESKDGITVENIPSVSKQRRYGVAGSEESWYQRQRKTGIAENKDSVSERTFLRVLHKKF